MHTVTAIIILLLFFAFLGSLVKPSFFVRWGARSRKGGLAYLAALVALSLALPAEKTSIDSTPEDSADKAQPVETVQKSEAQKDISITRLSHIKLAMKVTTDNRKPAVSVSTNLPNGTQLMATITYRDEIMGQDSAEVHNGQASFGPFSQNGAPYDGGTYTAEISSPMWELQPENVQAQIDTARLTGDCLNERGLITKTWNFSIMGPDRAKRIQAFKDEIQLYYGQLMAFKDGPLFATMGFGAANPIAQRWLHEVQALSNDAPKAFPFELRSSAGTLETLGREYLRTKGRENEHTRAFTRYILDPLAN